MIRPLRLNKPKNATTFSPALKKLQVLEAPSIDCNRLPISEAKFSICRVYNDTACLNSWKLVKIIASSPLRKVL